MLLLTPGSSHLLDLSPTVLFCEILETEKLPTWMGKKALSACHFWLGKLQCVLTLLEGFTFGLSGASLSRL